MRGDVFSEARGELVYGQFVGKPIPCAISAPACSHCSSHYLHSGAPNTKIAELLQQMSICLRR